MLIGILVDEFILGRKGKKEKGKRCCLHTLRVGIEYLSHKTTEYRELYCCRAEEGRRVLLICCMT